MSMEMHEKDEANMGPVLHIVVVGFHHKKGCQVEFSYPPLVPDGEHDSGLIPDEWKYLPFLALPDGAHNYQEDTVYFHLPPLSADQKCVYGVSCYRQIEAKALKVRQADVTRETVQKSVCVLSRVPLYGLLQAKLQLITHAYFEEKDFSQISILKELYDHMNSSLRGSALEGSQVYLGLSPRDLILHFQHKVLILFKLILLEKKVLFYVSPVNRLVGALMTVLSLFPGLVEHGLVDSSHYKPRSSISEDTSVSPESGSAAEEFVSVSVTDLSEHEGSRDTGQSTNQRPERSEGAGTGTNQKKMPLTGANGDSCGGTTTTTTDNNFLKPPSRTSPDSSESDWETLDPSVLDDTKDQTLDQPLEPDRYQIEQIPDAFESPTGTPITSQPLGGAGGVSQGLVSGLEEDQYGLPLAIFTKGYLCLPYMALQQHHLLSDISIRGFVAGATNILFRQQRHLSDVVIEVEEARIQTQDPDLRRALALTTADLRFVDYLVKHVTENRDDVFLDGTGWEGGDEWIRAQFTLYLHSLLASALHQDNERLLADYGAPFITAWKMTHNYRVWISNKHSGMTHITAGHPFQGQYSVADVKLRLSHSVQNSERGKKIGNAMMTTSRSMVQTGKAVGQSLEGALTSAKSAMSSWFSTLATPSSITHQSEPSAPPTDPPTEAQQ